MAKVDNIFQALKKACEWRIIALAIDFTVAILLTHKFGVSVGIASLSSVVKFVTNTIWIRKRFS